MTVKSCLKSLRLRTLPLSLAGIIVGLSLSSSVSTLHIPVVITLLLTAAFLQILSNLSNELGDTLHGTDTPERQGIRYSLQDGDMTIPQMKRLIAVIAALCCISGLALIFLSYGKILSFEPICLLVLGIAAIRAAMHYTLGSNPYGYRGLGDLFVFIFFGLVSVLGAGFVCSHAIEPLWTLPAAAIGCWSIGVLNVNNIRDMKTDAATRTTVAMKLGLKKARIYQVILISAGWLLMIVFSVLEEAGPQQYLYVLTSPLFALHLRGALTREDRMLDPILPLLVMSTFATAILFAAGNLCYLCIR